MSRVHRNLREGYNSRFTNESKFWGENSSSNTMAAKAIFEGDELRRKLQGHRILVDVSHTERELRNAFKL